MSYSNFSSDNTYVYTYRLSNYDEDRYERNFDQLITERGEDTFIENNTNNFYKEIFDKIRDKLFTLGECDIDIIEKERKIYTEKYKIDELNDSINEFKKNITFLYNKKIELEIEIENKTKNYNDFCNHIKELIKNINSFNGPEEDIQLKEMLSKRIDWYYEHLNLENLMNEKFQVVSEYSFLKTTINNLQSINYSTVCNICLENQVSWFIDPCGHSLCEDCKTKTEKTSTCHYCRTKKIKHNKFYF